jgi:hypothetical protein
MMLSQLIGPSRYHRRLGDRALISAGTNCVEKRETSNDVEAGPVARSVFLLPLLHNLDVTIFGDGSKWNERPIRVGSQWSGSRLTIAE